MYASHYHCLPGLQFLLELGADPFWKNNKDDTVIKMFARRGQKEMAKVCNDLKPISEKNESKEKLST